MTERPPMPPISQKPERPRRRNPLHSRKFWLALTSFVAVFVNQTWGIELEPAALAAVVLPIVAYILGEAWVDAKH